MKKNLLLVCMIAVFSFGISSSSWSILYDFEDKKQLDDWEVKGAAKWSIDKGVLVCEEQASGIRQQERIEHKKIEFIDGTIEFKMQWLNGTWLEGGVFYRLKDDINWYNVHLSNCCAPVAPSVRWMAMVASALDWRPQGIKLDKNVWYQVKVIVEGERHQVFVDGKQLWDVKHKGFEKGKLAIGTWSAVAETWQLDELKISGKGIPEAVEPNGKLAVAWGRIKTR
jgi:hypothetical protein